MAINNTRTSNIFSGNDATTVFDTDVSVEKTSELVVQKISSQNIITDLAINVDYSINSASVGKNTSAQITYPLSGSPLATGDKLYVRREAAIVQDVALSTIPGFVPENAEIALDRLALRLQEVENLARRGLKLPIAGAEGEIPLPIATSYLQVNADGELVLTVTAPGSAAPVDISIFGAISDAEAANLSAVDYVIVGGIIHHEVAGREAFASIDGKFWGPINTANFSSWGPSDNGSTDDRDKFVDFVNYCAAQNLPGIIDTTNAAITNWTFVDTDNISLSGIIGATTLKRITSTGRMIGFRDSSNISITDVEFNTNFLGELTQGDGIAAENVNNMHITDCMFTDISGDATSSGVGILLYTNVANQFNQHIRLENLILKASVDAAMQDTYGIIAEDIKYSFFSDIVAEGFDRFAVELKNESYWNVLSSIISYKSHIGIGGGFDAVTGAYQNVFGLLVASECDQGFGLSNGEENLITGLVVHANNNEHPDRYSNDHVYGIHIAASSNRNVVTGTLISGDDIVFPVRLRGNSNYVDYVDHSTAANTLTLEAGVTRNVVEIKHTGSRNEVVSDITDGPGVWSGGNANILTSHPTREYFGSFNGKFVWSLQGPQSSHNWHSTQEFRFEGAGLNTVLGLAIGTAGRAGISVADADHEIIYDEASSTWETSIADTVVEKISANEMTLNFTQNPADPTNNGELVVGVNSNTELVFKLRGTDGTLRTATVALSA